MRRLPARVAVGVATWMAAIGMAAEVLLLPAGARPTPALAMVLAGLGLAGGTGLVMGRRPLPAAALSAVACGVLFEWIATWTGRLLSELLLAGAALAGWLCGAWAARLFAVGGADPEVQDTAGREVALGALGAAWLLAGISKLLDGGQGWVGPGTVWHVLFSHLDLDAALDTPWAAVVAAPELATGLALGVLVAELSAPLLVIRGWPRRALGVGLALLHGGLSLVGFAQWPVALGILALAWPDSGRALRWRPRARAGVVAAVALAALAWALPIDRWLAVPKGRRSDAWHIRGDEADRATKAGHHTDDLPEITGRK